MVFLQMTRSLLHVQSKVGGLTRPPLRVFGGSILGARWLSSSSHCLSPEQTTGAILTAARSEPDGLFVQWSVKNKDQGSGKYSYLWLRDNCQCEQCVHPTNRQKLHSSADVPLDIEPTSVQVKGQTAEILWNKPLRHQKDESATTHISRYSLDLLRRYATQEASEAYRFNHIRPQTWSRDEYKLKWISYDDYMTTDAGLHEAVLRLYNRGLVFMDQVPVKDESVTKVAERIGPVLETFYGRDFDVKNVAKSTNIAYTSLYLGFHMDLM